MNEDERGVTPPDVTAMSVEYRDGLWWVIVEQGNGDLIKEIELTDMERAQLACLLETGDGNRPRVRHVEFVDVSR